jgi:ribosomal protein S20
VSHVKRLSALAAVVAAFAALALAGSASAAESPSLADDVAARLGIPVDKLRAAFRDALAARIDAAVEAGKLTPDQAAKLKERLEHAKGLGIRIRNAFARHGHALVPRLHAHLHAHRATAKYLDLSPRELREELREGKSLAEIAAEQGKSVDGLVDALVEPAKKRLDAAVDRGLITRERADAILERLTEGVAKLVERARAR